MGHRSWERHLAGEVNGLDEKDLDTFVSHINGVRLVSLLQAVLRRLWKDRGPKLHLGLDSEHEVLVEVKEISPYDPDNS